MPFFLRFTPEQWAGLAGEGPTRRLVQQGAGLSHAGAEDNYARSPFHVLQRCGKGHNRPAMLRLLPFLDADGPTQMAADEALLESAQAATLRLYRWTPATVSLGYFQDHAAIAPHLPAGMPLVRRITGGGAIWHEHEVTYCLVGTLGRDGWPQRVRDCYPLLHGALRATLKLAGATLEQQAESVGDRRYRDEPRCFASPATDDLVHGDGGKVLGSAGRVRGECVLIHGSLKLASNPWDGDAVRGCGLTFERASAVMTAAFAAALGQTLTPGEWSADELAARERIRGVRYGDDGWVVARRGPRP
ncbi:MAG: lipoate--protein ligase family protein [Planctomycetes bacterium]|nr:lipoate--protein ligase family protein [Planctomycetota bacterium]